MILDAAFPPDYRVEKEAITLIEHGHEVILFCLTYTGKFFEEEYKKITLAHYPSNKLEYKLSALAYTIPLYRRMMERKLTDFVDRYAPEVLHVHDMIIAEAAMVVAEKYSLKVVLDLHENRPASMKEYRHLKNIPGRWLIKLENWERKQIDLVNRATKVVVVTSLAKADLVNQAKKHPEDIIAVPNTSTLAFHRNSIEEKIVKRMAPTFNLLYIGDTSTRRGTSDALHVIHQLKETIPQVRLWMIGTSSADAELQALANELGIMEHVVFEGWQPEKLFASYITGAHICLSPLRRNPHHDTTFANKVFQYMSLGRPLLVSDCPAQAELIQTERCGLVYDAGNVAQFAAHVVFLYENVNIRNEFGENARKAVLNTWNWEKTSRSLLELYDALL